LDGYKALADRVLADATREALRLNSADIGEVATAIFALEFLGNLRSEAWFRLAGYEQVPALERMGYESYKHTALARLHDPDVYKAVMHVCNLRAGAAMKQYRRAHATAPPSKLAATRALSRYLFNTLAWSLENQCGPDLLQYSPY